MNIQDENFALGFELKALADLTVLGKAERWVPGYIWPIVEREHRLRYEFAANYTSNKKVLEVACGCGEGSLILAKKGNAASVWAADIDQDSIRYGNIRFPSERISRHVMDVAEFNISDEFDVVVSFETIEHLENPDDFLNKIHRALKLNGLLIISTPIAARTTNTPFNPYHKIEWSYQDFHNLLLKKFVINKVLVQSLEVVQSRLMKVIDRFVSRKVKTPDPTLKAVTGELEMRNIFRGYQVVVCQKS